MKNNRFGILLIAALIILAIGLAVLGPMLFRQKVPRESPPLEQTKGSFLAAKGIVESEEAVEISSQVKGEIVKMKADEGDMVKKGEPLVTLDKSKLLAKIDAAGAALAEAKAHLRELERGYRTEDIEMAKSRFKSAEATCLHAQDEYERQKRLYDKNATTVIELNRAEEKMKVAAEGLNESKAGLQKFQKGVRAEEIEGARAMVGKAAAELQYHKALLRDYTVLSPIDGVVAQRFKDNNETVDIGTPILKIINPQELRIRAELEESDVGKIKNGQDVEVYADAYRDTVFHGKVYKVFSVVRRKAQRTFDPAASFDINTQGIYIRLDDFSGLKDGMTVNVRFLK
jgi:multidrug resistance efflux pump